MASIGFPNTQLSAIDAIRDFPLTNKNFVVTSTRHDECGVYKEAGDYLDCFTSLTQSKVSVLLMSDFTLTVLKKLDWEASSGLRTPTNNIGNSIDTVNDPQKYPNYLQLSQSTVYYLLLQALILKNFQYTAINFFVDYSQSQGFEVLQTVFAGADIAIEIPHEVAIYDRTDDQACSKASKYLKSSSL
mmetsp:Transcript_29134/g.52112  ORF Transcript_29134/g.52112 Transcript_29134/m.52112 type:complete len:187 (+) Transcript_29134:905-1465(+)